MLSSVCRLSWRVRCGVWILGLVACGDGGSAPQTDAGPDGDMVPARPRSQNLPM